MKRSSRPRKKPCALACGRRSKQEVCTTCRAQVKAECLGAYLPRDQALAELQVAEAILGIVGHVRRAEEVTAVVGLAMKAIARSRSALLYPRGKPR